MATSDVEGTISLAEIRKAYSSNDDFLNVVNGLVEKNDAIADAPYVEATTITTNEVSRVIKLPSPSWTDLDEGWTAEMGRLQNDTEGMGTMNARVQINKKVARRQKDPARYMAMQEGFHLEAMAQEAEDTLVYGSSGTAPKEFDGWDLRYSSLDGNTWPLNGVFNNGETAGSTCTTFWLVQWHETDCCLIYPRYHPSAGLSREQMPDQLLPMADAASPYENQKKAWFHIVELEWSLGFSLADNRRMKRVANVNSDPKDADSFDEDVLSDALSDFDNRGQVMIYCNKQAMAQVRRRVNNKGNVQYGPSDPFGRPQLMFLDSPLRRMDSITNAEAVLTT